MEIVNLYGVRGYVDENGTVQLNLEDVSRGLGFTDNSKGTEYIRWNVVRQYLCDIGFSQKVAKDMFVPENTFYRLAMKARNEAAESFQTKVADEILPAIRKHGIYATDSVIDNILNNPDFGIELLTRLKEERAARVKAEQTNAILMHVNKTYTATEVAKELGFKSAVALNRELEERGIQFKVNGTWVLGAQHADCGYTEIKQTPLDNGKVVYDRRFTQLGREWLLNLFVPLGASG